MTALDDALPPIAIIAQRFVEALEDRGARFSWRGDSADWWLDLNSAADMTPAEAAEIAAAAFDIRDAIRAHLQLRSATAADVVH